jgi:hypothetical protein
METNDNPRCFLAVDISEIILKPLDLFIGISERAAVSSCIGASKFIWGLNAHWEVSLGVNGDEMRKTVVEGVPKVAIAT